MSRLAVFNRRSLIGLLSLILLSACSRLSPAGAGGDSGLTLTLQLNQAQFRPGEPVIAHLTLGNAGGAPLEAPQLDHTTVAFAVQPQRKDAPGELCFVEPVYSDKEQPGRMIRLAAAGAASGAALPREFVFTTLTFEPGTYQLEAVYTRPSASPLKPARKTYAKAAVFTVAPGQKAYAHRYINGLLSRQDAINVATAKAGEPVAGSDTLLITDEAGFPKWWVNLRLQAKPGRGGEQVKSYFVDTVFPKVWKEARPFTESDKGATPVQDAQALQKLKEKTIEKRVK